MYLGEGRMQIDEDRNFEKKEQINVGIFFFLKAWKKQSERNERWTKRGWVFDLLPFSNELLRLGHLNVQSVVYCVLSEAFSVNFIYFFLTSLPKFFFVLLNALAPPISNFLFSSTCFVYLLMSAKIIIMWPSRGRVVERNIRRKINYSRLLCVFGRD